MPPKKSPKKNAKKTDIVILVMGQTGAGKSTFINTLLKETHMEVGNTLRSCTRELGFGYIDAMQGHPNLQNSQIVVVDTPGFDGTYKGDLEILRMIVTWLQVACRKGATLGGVIYLHEVHLDRFTGTARKTLLEFQGLYGTAILNKVILGTTKWKRTLKGLAEENHAELERDHWKSLRAKGSQVKKFEDTYESAWSFIDALLRKHEQEEEKPSQKQGSCVIM